jgi:hypothetical protein
VAILGLMLGLVGAACGSATRRTDVRAGDDAAAPGSGGKPAMAGNRGSDVADAGAGAGGPRDDGSGGAALDNGRGGANGAQGNAATGPGGSSTDGTMGGPADLSRTTVVLFLVDGLMYEAVQTAVAAGANNFGMMLTNGVRVVTAHSTSPAAVIQLPAGSPGGTQPWARATSGNVAVHTGCHLFESNQMDDIFLATRAAGIKSVFSGGDANYAVFTTADFNYGAMMDDDVVVQHAIDHLANDHVRLIRVHLQRARDFWTGPANLTDPGSAYIRHLVEIDALLGRLIKALEDAGVWDSTYLVVAADHGMGQAASSTHVPATPSSWNPFMAFHGPGLKQGATIPYAELPDIAVTVMRFFQLPPLRGHLDPAVTLPVKGATGTVLTNLFAGQPAEIPHPRYIEACLTMGTACTSTGDDYAPYRLTMLKLIH